MNKTVLIFCISSRKSVRFCSESRFSKIYSAKLYHQPKYRLQTSVTVSNQSRFMKKLPVFLYPAVNKCARQECFHRYFTEQVRRHSMRSFLRLCPTGMCGLKSLHLTFPAAAKKKAPPVLYPLSCGHRPYGALFPCGFAVTVSYHIAFRLTHPHGCRFAVLCLRQMLTETKP